MTTSTHDIVQELWSLCNVLRDDGIIYHRYVTELTYLLFLKMAEETGVQEAEGSVHVPEGLRWADLAGMDGNDQLQFYRGLLVELGKKGSLLVQQIFLNAQTAMRQPRNLKKLVTSMDEIDWFSVRRKGLGDLYEWLLEKNANESKSGAGQYFTPRPLINLIVDLVDPNPGELIEDPAAGTGGFIIAADQHIKAKTDQLFELDEPRQFFHRIKAFRGAEIVPDTHRLGLMNMLLHDVDCRFELDDALSPSGGDLEKADVILTSPPFGARYSDPGNTRELPFPTSNQEFAFLQHVYEGLKPGGRAAVIVSDRVLIEDYMGRHVRADLMHKCDLHTILRLPAGMFYAHGVKANVLFFTRGEHDKGNTEAVWIYDMRTNTGDFCRSSALTKRTFDAFVAAWDHRTDYGSKGRFRCFSRDYIREHRDSLDISWLQQRQDEGPELASHGQRLPGLLLYLDSTVSAFDRFSLQALIWSLLGTDTSCRIVEFRETAELTFIRIDGVDGASLRTLGETIWKEVRNSSDTTSARNQELITAALDNSRLFKCLQNVLERLEYMELNQLSEEALEMLQDQGEKHVREKDIETMDTWGQRTAKKVIKGGAKRLLGAGVSELEEALKGSD